jgi:steroid delta-isomerase-like uncharacterized protein
MGDALEVQKAMFRVIEDHDFDALRALYHPDYTYTGSDGVEVAGADAGVEVARTYTSAFPDLSFEVLSHRAAGDLAVMEFRARGTHKEELMGIPATGHEMSMVVCNIVEARDGKIYREREYFDGAVLLRQLGVLQD